MSALGGELHVVTDVLPLAAGAEPEVLAGRRNAGRVGFQNLDYRSGSVLAVNAHHLRSDPFAGNAAEDENGGAVMPGQSFAQAAPRFEGQLQQVASLQALSRPSGFFS